MARSDPARGCAGPGPSVSFFSRGRQTGQRGQRDWAVFHKALVSLLTPWLSEWPELKLRGNTAKGKSFGVLNDMAYGPVAMLV